MSLRHTANPHPSDGDVGEFSSQPRLFGVFYSDGTRCRHKSRLAAKL